MILSGWHFSAFKSPFGSIGKTKRCRMPLVRRQKPGHGQASGVPLSAPCPTTSPDATVCAVGPGLCLPEA
jgi:hypothetical protein